MEINISTAKNALLPILAVPSLIRGKYTFPNVDLFTDVEEQIIILNMLNITTSYCERTIYIDSTDIIVPNDFEIKQHRKTRGVIYFMGSLLKYKTRIRHNKPGGCKIGDRKMDMHFSFFQKMGASVNECESVYDIDSTNFLETASFEFTFEKITVGGTINAILSSTYGRGEIILHNVAIDPYIIDIINLLKRLGSNIAIDSAKRIIFINRNYNLSKMKTIEYSIVDDPIIIGTYIVLSLMFNKDCTFSIKDISIMGNFIDYLNVINVRCIETSHNKFRFVKEYSTTKSLFIKTKEFPGFYTDLQPLFLCLCNHYAIQLEIVDNIMENRFLYCKELEKIGYEIEHINPNHVKLLGFKQKNDVENITLTDLRGGMAIYSELKKNGYVTDLIIIKNYDVLLRGYNMEYINNTFFDLNKK